MDSRTCLDSALFKLTPTRTRCDLVICSGGVNEKLASGLLQPFVAHLRLVKDEISKGGYSIRLCPASRDAIWFTKATIQRFVRFINYPEVLERFISIEKEISQIEISFQANEFQSSNGAGRLREGYASVANGTLNNATDMSKPQGESKDADESVEENSRVCLHRILETRRAMLRKEQAMAYARALVAGFELNSITDLISFATAFGASRLREACINFKDLCKKKQTDGLWMDELAAVQECSPSDLSLLGTSGIVLTNEANEANKNVTLSFLKNGLSSHNLVQNSSNESKYDQTNPTSFDGNRGADEKLPWSSGVKNNTVMWPNQIPNPMYNFPIDGQQMYPYPGYAHPSMQPVPPFYPRNMQWPPNLEEYRLAAVQERGKYKNHKSFSAKSDVGNELDHLGDDSQNESTDCDSDPNVDRRIKHSAKGQFTRKKHRKKSSRTVVIRNINYITSKKKDVLSETSSSEEDVLHSKDNLKTGKNKNKHEEEMGEHNIQNGSHDTTDQGLDKSRGDKINESWDAFQNLLLRDEETSMGVVNIQQSKVQDEYTRMSSEDKITFGARNAVDKDSEEAARKMKIVDDSFILTGQGDVIEHGARLVNFANGEDIRPNVKREDCLDGEILYTHQLENNRTYIQSSPCNSVADISVIKKGKADDWFIINPSEKSEIRDIISKQYEDPIVSCEDHNAHSGRAQKDQLIDDSFMVHARTFDDNYDDRWKTDISIVEDQVLLAENINTNSSQQPETSLFHEPDDVCMVLKRDLELGPKKVSLVMDYALDISLVETELNCPAAMPSINADETSDSKSKSSNKIKKEMPRVKDSVKPARSKFSQGPLMKSRSDIFSRSKKPYSASRPAIQKSKLEKEEEIRKRMEELSIQRQKRIAERTAANSSTSLVSKKIPAENKTAKGSISGDKKMTRPAVHGTNRISSNRQALQVHL